MVAITSVGGIIESLSLSLSPPFNRRRIMPAYRGSFVSLSEPTKDSRARFIEPDLEEDMLFDQQESYMEYRPGGYCPVQIGDLFNFRYHVIRKLGWGHFSTVWLSWDLQDKAFVALKIVKSDQVYADTARDEIVLLKAVGRKSNVQSSAYNIQASEKVIRLLNDFKIYSRNGTHICMVFEVMGYNLLRLIARSDYKGIHIQNVRTIIKQVLEGLNYLHTQCRIIHTDIKPENILMCIDYDKVRRMARDATKHHKIGMKLPMSLDVGGPPKTFSSFSLQLDPQHRPGSRNSPHRILPSHPTENGEIDSASGYSSTLQSAPETTLNYTTGHRILPAAPIQDPPSIYTSNRTITRHVDNRFDIDAWNVKKLSEHSELERISLRSSYLSQFESDTTINTYRDIIAKETKEYNHLERISKTSWATDSLRSKYSLSKFNIDTLNLSPKCMRKDTKRLPDLGSKLATSFDGSDLLKRPGLKPFRTYKSEDSAALPDFTTHQWSYESSTQPRSFDFITQPRATDSPVCKADRYKFTFDNKLKHNQHTLAATLSSDNFSSLDYDLNFTYAKKSNSTMSDFSLLDPANEVYDISVKIADLGNACWIDDHFADEIQTRQYRSVEVLIGAGYGPAADIWSTACMAFELATGDYLFDPKAGKEYSRDDDHLAHIVELVGPIPKEVLSQGKKTLKYFTPQGNFRRIDNLKPWGLYQVLTEKYHWSKAEASDFADFLLPMLHVNQYERASAAECLRHPWLNKRRSHY
uniref:non-specific serine/threonine protein kinase n=1 Tax=Cacopsylla melanoneura TaxID=428564 RepID=A0A8D9AUA6_9HEMI